VQEGELSEKVLELNVQIASALCAGAEIYLTDAWYASPPFLHCADSSESSRVAKL
jgi:hypothetical protein